MCVIFEHYFDFSFFPFFFLFLYFFLSLSFPFFFLYSWETRELEGLRIFVFNLFAAKKPLTHIDDAACGFKRLRKWIINIRGDCKIVTKSWSFSGLVYFYCRFYRLCPVFLFLFSKFKAFRRAGASIYFSFFSLRYSTTPFPCPHPPTSTPPFPHPVWLLAVWLALTQHCDLSLVRLVYFQELCYFTYLPSQSQFVRDFCLFLLLFFSKFSSRVKGHVWWPLVRACACDNACIF